MFCPPHDPIVSILSTIAASRRPRLLLRAARIGTADYRRETDLRRVLRLPAAPPLGPETVRTLIALEEELETQRTRPEACAGASWRASRHVEVMIALIAEARLMVDAATADGTSARRLTLVRPG
ncbi:MAG: hypothetical protein HLUCCA12_02920 [Rhodobacteraceae bacterium HLUCCA12]|nr:MAG: hypothetical protein HLUCCA12_02920 [Rhodobacteraceae bacterium HLUCCA12]